MMPVTPRGHARTKICDSPHPRRQRVAHLVTMLWIYYGMFLLLLEGEKLLEQILLQ
ncbi:hypothetical protein DFR68_11786 [Nocardia mexicana]|uniref:Uncharacterized protein n=1 Tax=Nocardia mexicana TaxID=279262 RepID=A0A370GMG4_9NOCA|nr:hypothetical protein DFR68_11786 [Nocardia mexicana]